MQQSKICFITQGGILAKVVRHKVEADSVPDETLQWGCVVLGLLMDPF